MMGRVLFFAVALALLAIAPACGSLGSKFCDLRCDCQTCSDEERDICVINEDEGLDRAAAYGCGAEADTYVNCAIDTGVCEAQMYIIDGDCLDHLQEINDCINEASDRMRGF